MECEFCLNHEQGDTLYELSDWDGGIGFDYIRDIKYCPLCGSLLDGEAKNESIIEVYNGNADKENWQCITIKPIEDRPQIEYDEYREKIKPHDPHKNWFEGGRGKE